VFGNEALRRAPNFLRTPPELASRAARNKVGSSSWWQLEIRMAAPRKPSEKVVCEKHGLPLISVIDRLPVNLRSPRVPWLRVRFQTRNQSERGELEEDLSLPGENRHRNSGRSNGSKHFARKYFCLDAYFSCIAR